MEIPGIIKWGILAIMFVIICWLVVPILLDLTHMFGGL